jgi:hypothetical protein
VLEQAKDGDLVLEAQFHGIGKDGGPACATVPLTREWSIARDVPETDFNLVRELAESLPDVVHAVSSRGEGLKVRGKLMACQATHKSADPNSIMARVSDTDRSRLIESDPKTYYITKHYENYPAVLVRLSLVGRAELERLLKISWQYVFEKSQMPGGV